MNFKYLFFVIILFFWLNFFSIKNFYTNYIWQKYFLSWDLENAEKYFQNNKTDIWKYNLAKIFYKKWDFSSAKNILGKIENKKLDFSSNYLLWDIFYRIWERENNLENKKNSWEKSILKYENALKIKEDEKIQKNIIFIKEKLKNLQKNDEKEEKKEETKNKNEENWNKKNQEKSQVIQEKLTKYEREEIEKYQENLKDFEKKYYNTFWKIEQEKDIFSDFFESGNKKDW